MTQVIKKVSAKGSHMDFMFLGPLTQLLGSLLSQQIDYKWHKIF